VSHALRRRVDERHDDAADVRKALLPRGVLDQDRNDVPTTLERTHPEVAIDSVEEVGEYEDERAGRQVASMVDEVPDRSPE
jgi:hypothetical protein